MQYTKKELDDCMRQLESLIDDRESFIYGDPSHDDIFIEDANALKIAIAIIKDWRSEHEN